MLIASVYFPDHTEHSSGSKNLGPLDESLEQDLELSGKLFNDEAIRWAINSFSPCEVAGCDGIFPEILQKCFDILLPILKIFFVRSHVWSYIPNVWRNVKVTYIPPKVGKRPRYEPKSYKPISLSSFCLKTMEKDIDRNIRDDILTKLPLNQNQPGKSTVSTLQNLVTKIKKTFDKKVYAL